MRSKEEFTKFWQYELASILLEGYITKERDAAALYRMMSAAVIRLRDKLGQMHDEMRDK